MLISSFDSTLIIVGVSPALALRGRAIRCKSSFATLTAGFPLLSLTRITRVYTRYVYKNEVFFYLI